VWSLTDSQKLIESILLGIPLPSVILTKLDGQRVQQIVDGKQRLTAILRFVGRHPSAWKWVDSGAPDEAGLNDQRRLFEADHKKYMKKRHVKAGEANEKCLPFRLGRFHKDHPLHNLSGKYYCEIRDSVVDLGGAEVSIREIFDDSTSNYYVPVIIYEKTRLQDIHYVFSIYNKQGRKLNAEELRNATFHHLGITKLLLVLSGDRPNSNELAPYLPGEVRTEIGEVGETLKDKGFGTARFRRTKVLAWTCAILLHAPNSPRAGTFVTPSTASHIDSFLEDISKRQGAHKLFQNTTLTTLAKDVKAAVALHAEVDDAWAPRFRCKRGHASDWEELPLVGSLLTCLILVVSGQASRLEAGIGDVRGFTQALPALTKTHNKTQWGYIARVAIGVLQTVGADFAGAAAALEQRYGYSCIGTLSALAETDVE
jgi:hypothetical protein